MSEFFDDVSDAPSAPGGKRPPQLVSELGNSSWLYRLDDRREIIIKMEDDLSKIEVVDLQNKQIGILEFDFQETDYDDKNSYLLVYAFMDRAGPTYKRKGIATLCLEIFRQHAHYPLVAREDDGNKYEDGSYLTGDAPPFVSEMKKRGLILKESNDLPYNEDDET